MNHFDGGAQNNIGNLQFQFSSSEVITNDTECNNNQDCLRTAHCPVDTTETSFADINHTDNWISMNSFQKLSSQSSMARERIINIIKVLADLLTSHNIPYPLYVGLFNKTSPGIRTTHLNKLAEEIIYTTKPIKMPSLKVSYLLILFPSISAILIGFILGLTINWVFGLVFGASTIVLTMFLIGLILIGSKNKRSSNAVSASKKLAEFMETLELFFQVLFCYPKDTDLMSKPITPMILLLNLADYSSTNHLSLAIADKVWTAVENKYNKLITRLQCCCKMSDSEGRFKQICCIPTFVLVILFTTAILTNATLLSIYRNRQIKMFTNTKLLPIFVLMTCIIFLGFFSILPVLCKSILKLFKSPACSIHHYLQPTLTNHHSNSNQKHYHNNNTTSSNATKYSQGQKNKKKVNHMRHLDNATIDSLVKQHLERVSLLISTFEAYQCKEQIRIYIMINTTDTCNRHTVANTIYQLQNLTMTHITVPIVTILAADFHTLVNDGTLVSPISSEINFYQQFSDSFHLLHSTFHLPVYMDECSFCCASQTFSAATSTTGLVESRNPPQYSSNEMFCLRGGSSFESLNMAISGSKSTPLPIANRHAANSSNSINDSGTESVIRLKMMMNMKSGSDRLSLKRIQQLFLAKPEVTEINTKIIKQLLITASYFDRILRMNKIEFTWDQLIDWITISIHWPFRINMLLYYVGSASAELDNKMPFRKVAELVDNYINDSSITNSEKDFFLLSQDDKNIDIFNSYLSTETSANFNIEEMRSYSYYSCFINPYFQTIIKDHLGDPLSHIQEKNLTEIQETPKAIVQNPANPDIMDEVMKTPVAVRKTFIKLKNSIKLMDLSQMQKKEVIQLLTFIDTIDPVNLATYQHRLVELNVTGLVLSICDLDNLQRELKMNFGDWQIFKALIVYLRELESVKMIHLLPQHQTNPNPNIPDQTFDNLAFWQDTDNVEYFTEDEDEEEGEEEEEEEGRNYNQRTKTTQIHRRSLHDVENGGQFVEYDVETQVKSASSSLTNKDTAPIIARTKSRGGSTGRIDGTGRQHVRANSKVGKKKKPSNLKDKSDHMVRSCNEEFYFQDAHPNQAYTASMSESVDKISSKSHASSTCSRTKLLSGINHSSTIDLSPNTKLHSMPPSDASQVMVAKHQQQQQQQHHHQMEHNVKSDCNNQVQQCTCDYWFTFGRDRIPLARVVANRNSAINDVMSAKQLQQQHYITAMMSPGTDMILTSDNDDSVDDTGHVVDEDEEDEREMYEEEAYHNTGHHQMDIEEEDDDDDDDEENNPRLCYVLPESVHAPTYITR